MYPRQQCGRDDIGQGIGLDANPAAPVLQLFLQHLHEPGDLRIGLAQKARVAQLGKVAVFHLSEFLAGHIAGFGILGQGAQLGQSDISLCVQDETF